MKVLFVTGDDDFSAMMFEESAYTPKSVAESLESKGQDTADFELTDGEIFTAKLYTFKDIDPAFIDFIRNEVQDYDDSKHKNFYVLGD